MRSRPHFPDVVKTWQETAIHGHCVCLDALGLIYDSLLLPPHHQQTQGTKCFLINVGLWMTRHLGWCGSLPDWHLPGLAQETCVWDFFYLGPVKVLELFVHQDLGVNRTGHSRSEVWPGCCSCWRGTILTANSITGSNSVGIDRYTIHAACWASQCGCCTETEKQATKKLQAKLQSIMNEFTCVPQQPGHGKNGRSNFMLDVEIFRCRATTFSTLLIIVSFLNSTRVGWA